LLCEQLLDSERGQFSGLCLFIDPLNTVPRSQLVQAMSEERDNRRARRLIGGW
jgi:hypothetical protein